MEITGSVLSVTLSDVSYVPDWNEACLISCSKIDILCCFRMVHEDGFITVQRKSDHSPVFIAELMHGCYQVLPLARHNKIYTAATDFWQQALGYSSTRFCSTATDIYAYGSILPKRPSAFFCPACAKYNSKHSVPPPVSNAQSKNPWDLIQSDLLVPLSVESLGRRKYMLMFGEDKTRNSEVNLLHKKSDALCLIKAFCEKVNTQTQRYPRSFRTHQGGQFVNGDLEAYFKEKAITHQQTAAYSHQSNGVAERHTQTLSAMVRPALEHAPPSLWAEGYNWACYIKNRLPHSALYGITAYEALYNAKPYISHLRPFYTKCQAHIDKEKCPSSSKLEPRSIEARLVG